MEASALLLVNTTSLPGPLASEPHTLPLVDTLLVPALLVILVVGVGGNLLVCYVFMRMRKRLATMETLICWLALTDLTASIVNPTMFTYWTLTGDESEPGLPHREIWCVLVPAVSGMSVALSLGIMATIMLSHLCRTTSIPGQCICHFSITNTKDSVSEKALGSRLVCRSCRPRRALMSQHQALLTAAISLCILLLCELPNIMQTYESCGLRRSESNKSYSYAKIFTLVTRDLFFLAVLLKALVTVRKLMHENKQIN